MWPRGVPRTPYTADSFTTLHVLAHPDLNRTSSLMRIEGDDPITVIDHHCVAVTATVPGVDDLARACSDNRTAFGSSNVECGVKSLARETGRFADHTGM